MVGWECNEEVLEAPILDSGCSATAWEEVELPWLEEVPIAIDEDAGDAGWNAVLPISQYRAHLRLQRVYFSALVHFSCRLKLCVIVKPSTLSFSILKCQTQQQSTHRVFTIKNLSYNPCNKANIYFKLMRLLACEKRRKKYSLEFWAGRKAVTYL